jgi:hypothetical protein
VTGLLDPGPMASPPHAPGVKITREVELRTRTTAFELSVQLGRRFEVSQESLMHPDGERRLEALLERELSVLQAHAIGGLGLEAWRDEHERELEAKAKRERLELVRALYAAARNATSLEAVQLLLADELEAQR